MSFYDRGMSRQDRKKCKFSLPYSYTTTDVTMGFSPSIPLSSLVNLHQITLRDSITITNLSVELRNKVARTAFEGQI